MIIYTGGYDSRLQESGPTPHVDNADLYTSHVLPSANRLEADVSQAGHNIGWLFNIAWATASCCTACIFVRVFIVALEEST